MGVGRGGGSREQLVVNGKNEHRKEIESRREREEMNKRERETIYFYVGQPVCSVRRKM